MGEFEVGHYYRLQATNSDLVSSLLLVHPPDEPSPILLMFWIAWNETRYGMSEDDLRRIDGLDLPQKHQVLCGGHSSQRIAGDGGTRGASYGPREGRLRISF